MKGDGKRFLDFVSKMEHFIYDPPRAWKGGGQSCGFVFFFCYSVNFSVCCCGLMRKSLQTDSLGFTVNSLIDPEIMEHYRPVREVCFLAFFVCVFLALFSCLA